jgi:hypothetical protein
MKSVKDLKEQRTALLNLRDNGLTSLGKIDAAVIQLEQQKQETKDKLVFISGKLAILDELLKDEQDSIETNEKKDNGEDISKP